MQRCTLGKMRCWAIPLVFLAGLSSSVLAAEPQNWEPFATESTLEVLTVDREGIEHWSKFWPVIIDGQLYLRLARRGAARIEGNTRKPFVSVKIAGQRFDDVRVTETPELAEAVASAMARKYWSDIIIRLFTQPMTVRLERGW